jgi:hypothetical protein
VPKIFDFIKHFNSMENEIEQGELIRFVYDVSQGAVFFGQILQGSRDNIIGITVYQENVDYCMVKFGELVDEVRRLRGLNPIVKPINI